MWFEKDWDDYVEVDKNGSLMNKEKLEAVVTRLLVTDGSLSEVSLYIHIKANVTCNYMYLPVNKNHLIVVIIIVDNSK